LENGLPVKGVARHLGLLPVGQQVHGPAIQPSALLEQDALDLWVERYSAGKNRSTPLPHALTKLAAKSGIVPQGVIQAGTLQTLAVVAPVATGGKVGGEFAHFN